MRPTHKLGSAYGQNAIDQAVTILHNHFTRIKNNVYGNILNNNEELLPYISFVSLLNAAIKDEDEIKTLDALISTTNSKNTVLTYKNTRVYLTKFSEEQRSSNREYVRALFYDKLDSWKRPFVKKATLQLDTRVSKIEKSHSTKEDFVVSIKLLNERKRIEFPVSTSRNGLRRLSQYKNGSMTATIRNGKIRIGVPITKKVKKQKQTELLGIDQGITDLFYTSSNNRYGSFTGKAEVYEQTLERKLGNRSSLRNKRKAYQKQLKLETVPRLKEQLRMKIKNISENLNGKKSLEKERKRYNYLIDYEISKACKGLFNEIKANQYLPVLEDLDITEFDRGRKANKRDSLWIRGKLINKLIQKLEWQGYNYITVDPTYTSKMCSNCFNLDDNNRKGKKFTCTVCKYTADSDYNASINIRQRAYDNEIAEVVEKYKFSTKKRHQALRDILLKRHSSYMKQIS